jgi:hypothetical protein
MSKEFENFDAVMKHILKAPHVEIKKKLEKEKEAKKRKKARKSSASREAV